MSSIPITMTARSHAHAVLDACVCCLQLRASIVLSGHDGCKAERIHIKLLLAGATGRSPQPRAQLCNIRPCDARARDDRPCDDRLRDDRPRLGPRTTDRATTTRAFSATTSRRAPLLLPARTHARTSVARSSHARRTLVARTLFALSRCPLVARCSNGLYMHCSCEECSYIHVKCCPLSSI